jgi:hypothetical protein
LSETTLGQEPECGVHATPEQDAEATGESEKNRMFVEEASHLKGDICA